MTRDLGDDPEIVARIRWRVDRLANPLHPPLAVGDRPLGLAPARRRREHDVGQLSGRAEKQVLNDEVLQAVEQGGGTMLVRLRLCGVLADDVERCEIAALHRLEHLRHVPAITRLDRGVPGALERRAHVGIENVLEARKAIGNRAHVAATLHVVLTAQRVESRAVTAHVSGKQREVDQREHVVDGIVMLGDAERPADHGAIGSRVGVSGLLNGVRRNARLALRERERVGLDAGPVRLESSRGVADESRVRETCMNDLAGHGVGERDVAPDVESHPHVGPLGARRATRIDDVQPRAIPHALENVMEEDRVRFARIRSPEEDDVRLLRLTIGARATARTEHCRQTDDAGSVSGPVTAVDVVRAEGHARQLLREKIHLVRGLRAAEDPDRVRSPRGDAAPEPVGRAREGFVPRRGPQDAALTDERRAQALQRGDLLPALSLGHAVSLLAERRLAARPSRY